jgi:hypothetical protein
MPIREMREMEDWAGATIAGFRAMSACQWRDAAQAWLNSLEMQNGSPEDPRRAAAQTNGASAYALLGLARDAERTFQIATQSWMRLLARLPDLDVPIVGTSSSFHFRLASQSLASFAEARRRRYAQLCESCLGITRFNALFADRSEPPAHAGLAAATRSLVLLLSDTLGRRSPEVRVLCDGDYASAYTEKVSEIENRGMSMAGSLSDGCQCLETAIALTALIAPALFATPALRNETTTHDPELSRKCQTSR